MYRPMTQQEKDEWDDREEMLRRGIKSPDSPICGESLQDKEIHDSDRL